MEHLIVTESDNYVAQVLKESYSLSAEDAQSLASTAISALFAYEEMLTEQFVQEHPDTLTQIPKVCVEADLRKDLSAKIRKIHCHFEGTSAIAFGAARELAAMTVDGDED